MNVSKHYHQSLPVVNTLLVFSCVKLDDVSQTVPEEASWTKIRLLFFFASQKTIRGNSVKYSNDTVSQCKNIYFLSMSKLLFGVNRRRHVILF